MKSKIISIVLLSLLTACVTVASSNSAREFINSARGKVVTWSHNDRVYAIDYVDQSKDIVITARRNGKCDKGTFTTNGNEICYNFSGQLKATNPALKDCWTVTKTSNGYQMNYDQNGRHDVAITRITNERPFTCSNFK